MTRKTVSLAELIKEKAKYKIEDKPKPVALNVPRLGGDIVIEVTKELCRDAIEMTADEDADADAYLIYTALVEPNVKDKELQTEYEVDEPTDIVRMLFTDGEITDIVETAFKSVGYERGTVKVVEEVKN